MTKEPIMIDEVDVSGCEEHFLNKYNEHMCCDYKTSDCSLCKPKQKQCYFYVESIENKLKNKEQECEEWKNKYYGSTTEVKADLIKQVDQLKKENEQLKKSVRSNKDKRKRAIERYLKLKEFTNKEFEKLKAYIKDDLVPHAKLYKQALQKIKEIIIEFSKQDILTFPDRKPEENYKFIQVQFREPIIQILQKCEVIKDE